MSFIGQSAPDIDGKGEPANDEESEPANKNYQIDDNVGQWGEVVVDQTEQVPKEQYRKLPVDNMLVVIILAVVATLGLTIAFAVIIFKYPEQSDFGPMSSLLQSVQQNQQANPWIDI
jgi:hypothetical protein